MQGFTIVAFEVRHSEELRMRARTLGSSCIHRFLFFSQLRKSSQMTIYLMMNYEFVLRDAELTFQLLTIPINRAVSVGALTIPEQESLQSVP
jgi:hypothetical protein